MGGSSSRRGMQQRHDFNLSGLSRGYLWRPWFSQLSLQYDGSYSYLQSNLSSADARSSSDNWNLSNRFGARLSLLPDTRMPFELSMNASQRVSDRGADSWTYGFTIRQQFSPLRRRSLQLVGRYSLGLDQDVTRQDFSFSARDRIGLHDLDADFDWSVNRDEGPLAGQDSSYSLQGSHSVALADRGVSITNFVSRIDSQASGSSGLEVNQFYNTVRWLPPVYLGRLDYRGTSRVVVSEFGSAQSNSQLVHSSALGYRVTPDLSATANLGFSVLDGGYVVSNESVGLSYSPPQQEWGAWRHGWGGSGSIGFSQSDQGNTKNASVSLNQRLSREIEQPGAATARLDLNQGGGSSWFAGDSGPVYSLSHGVSFSRSNSGDESDSNWQLSASDSRQLDTDNTDNQLLRGSYSYSRFDIDGGVLETEWDAELFRAVDVEQAESIGVSAAALVRYRESSFFAISRLNYHSEARLDWLDNIKAAEGDAQESVLTWTLSSELRWSWGLLSLSGILDFSGTREVADAGLRIEARRLWRPLN
ncbi:MAG: hypothetical protein V7629_09635 [Motiliproteus sp.]